MASKRIEPGADRIDSRDVIERIEELQELIQNEVDAQNAIYMRDAQEGGPQRSPLEPDLDDPNDVSALVPVLNDMTDMSEELEELEALLKLKDQAQDCADWEYGETLIHYDHFTDYTEELIKDCCEFPKGHDSDRWPWRHMQMDYEAAAEELKDDYTQVTYWGETYLVRN